MEVWLIEEGERRGPFPAFEIERRIRAGEVDAAAPAWIEGAPSWRPLGETPAFAGSFAAGVAGPVAKPAAAAVPAESPVPAVTSVQLLRRFWARWFDLHLFGLLWWGGMRLAGHDLAAMMADLWMLLWQMVPWFLLEALMIHRFGTTPGKWLLGIRVLQADGRPPRLAASLWRSLRVWTLGLGLGMPLLVLLCQGLSWWVSRRLGRPLWDVAGDHRVSSGPVPPLRAALFVGLFTTLVALRGWVLMPVVEQVYGEQLRALRRVERVGS